MSEKFAMRDWPTRNYQFTLPLRYHLSEPKGPGLVICLHGFQDHALSMIRRIGWWEASLPFQILAVNGPFPVPHWTGEGFREAYSWYFRDTSENIMLIHPTTTSQTLKRLIIELGHELTPKIIFGFSQGGYLAPYLAAQLQNTRAILGLGCGYFHEGYQLCPPITVHAIHGDQDERIPIENAKRDLKDITKFGHQTTFHEVPGLTHRVEYSVEPLVRQLAMEGLK